MSELPCRANVLSKLVFLSLTATALLSSGCAQLPGYSATAANPIQSGASSITDWPTPAISNTAAPTPPEPTLLPQAERPADKNPEALRNSRRDSTAPATTTDAGEPPRDVWQRIRNGFQMSHMTGNLVSDWETYYATRPEYFARMIENSRPFLFHIITEVERRGMPAEIALLPMIESAYNPVAYSSAHASGIWQFIPSTGKNYGLKQNGWYDGRRDVIAATNAALDYLQNLHGMFKDWELALASYNWGEGAVQRAVDRNQAKGLSATYQTLTNMPAETRNYLPKLIAVKNIIADPARFGLNLASVPNEPAIEAITLKRHIDVAVAAKFADMTPEEFKFLNPAHTRPVINANSAETIVLPKHKVAVFMTNLNEHDDKPLASWKTYTVKAGERAETIAKKHSISVAELNAANNIGGRRQIATGQTILVPAIGEMQPVLAEVAAPVQVAARAPVRRPVARAPARKAAPGTRVITTRVPPKPAAAKPAVRKPIAQTASR
ncbi:MAG: transglycosylase SLT domain-containing protein [Burkholderiales bacterium]